MKGRTMKFLLSVMSACLIGSLVLGNPIPAMAKGPALSKAEALKIADREMQLMGNKPAEWKAQADESNSRWKEASTRRRNGVSQEGKQLHEKEEAKLKGHDYWAIRYEHLVSPGGTKKAKAEEAWIFVAKDSKQVLLVILPGA
jgi:hypothetical protein